MKVIIIEDEKPSARRLMRLLEKREIEVHALLHSVSESLEWFHNNEHPDLIFLDIQLSDGLSFEIFDNIQINAAIIFTTAYDEYALKAFKLNSIDYLLKPIDEEELENALKQYDKKSSKSANFSLGYHEVRKLLGGNIQPTFRQRFSVKVGLRIKLIEVVDVECFYCENKGTYLYSKGMKYLLETSLEQLEKELNPQTFFRVNRSTIIALRAIEEIIKYSNSRLKVNLLNFKELEIIVARERVRDFKKWIENGALSQFCSEFGFVFFF